MEEKERYEWNSRFDEAIKDNQTGDIVNAVEVLNQQDKRIKELEEMQKAYREISYNETLQTFELNNIKSENQQLKQQLVESEKKFIVANNLRKNSDEVLLNYKTQKYGLDKTIQELRKTKLSLPEKEWYYKGFENCERKMSSHIADLTLEVNELKQQLAEKDAEIASYKKK